MHLSTRLGITARWLKSLGLVVIDRFSVAVSESRHWEHMTSHLSVISEITDSQNDEEYVLMNHEVHIGFYSKQWNKNWYVVRLWKSCIFKDAKGN